MTESSSVPKEGRILFLGGGNMASAMIAGLIAHGTSARHIHVVDTDIAACNRARALGCAAYPLLQHAPVDAMDVIVLAVKPQVLQEAVVTLKGNLTHQLVLSICAGVPSAAISSWLGGHRKVVRAMPNTPALIGKGITGLVATGDVDAQARAQAEAIVAATGTFSWFEEEAMIDAVTAVSGSGPAYVFLFIEAHMQAAQELGFSPQQAREFALATFAGAVELAQRSEESPGTLRERVTSKGGTTAAALAVMEARGVKDAIVAAVKAADARGKQLGAQLANPG
jgi:pyrroline-5-carboxylate reductase